MSVWGWVPFSALEMQEALTSCSNMLAPGPDHIKWSHLKMLMHGPTHIFTVLLSLANACLWVGHWPKHFKESMSVVIPKLNKLFYSTPKVLRPIVLLNTVGKLIKKMLSNCIQFNSITSDVFYPNQIRGICQRFTKDAGLILMHMVHAGWVKGLKTSVIAFDVPQFFLSLNYEVLIAILWKLGFSANIVKFFSHYLVGRSTQYAWGDFFSDLCQADVGVGQSSTMSPVLSTMAPLLYNQSHFLITVLPLNGLMVSYSSSSRNLDSLWSTTSLRCFTLTVCTPKTPPCQSGLCSVRFNPSQTQAALAVLGFLF
ncbi:hypothetical protein CVT25_014425 [Psilocybe cyanescens]|uniref:Uncharacterized protein n=1 Tax=Psilocybe cyanescens TaxID=93625 RepID=A0A409XRI6_PSICY|nr:hypothetical protein CVT25_014425 [Psilocybe cyanescens]